MNIRRFGWRNQSSSSTCKHPPFSVCPPPTPPHMLFFSGPVSPSYKRPTVQRRDAGLRHSNQLLLINVHSQEEKNSAYLHTHAEKLVWSAVTAHLEQRETVSLQNFGYLLFSISHKKLKSTAGVDWYRKSNIASYCIYQCCYPIPS